MLTCPLALLLHVTVPSSSGGIGGTTKTFFDGIVLDAKPLLVHKDPCCEFLEYSLLLICK